MMATRKQGRAARLQGLVVVFALTLAGTAFAAAPKAAKASPPAAKTAPVPAPAAASRGWGKLVSKDGKQVIWLKAAEVIVGSAASATARIEHPTVSARQARLTHVDGVVHVSDLKSRYGTLMAGTALRKGAKMQIFQPTTLSFGAVDMRFEWGDRGRLIKPLRKASPNAGKSSKGVKAKAKTTKSRAAKPKAKRKPRAAAGKKK